MRGDVLTGVSTYAIPTHVRPCWAVLTRLTLMQVRSVIRVFDSRQLHVTRLERFYSNLCRRGLR